MIISPFTTPIAQASYDSMRKEGVENERVGNIHFAIQMANMVAHTATPLYMTSMSNPHIMSYAYKGLPAERFGIAKAMSSRKEFQMMSSKSYQMGSVAARRFGPRAANIAGKFAVRAVPGLGWAMLAYDAYDLVANQRLFGIQL